MFKLRLKPNLKPNLACLVVHPSQPSFLPLLMLSPPAPISPNPFVFILAIPHLSSHFISLFLSSKPHILGSLPSLALSLPTPWHLHLCLLSCPKLYTRVNHVIQPQIFLECNSIVYIRRGNILNQSI